jgi:hypothetical protein
MTPAQLSEIEERLRAATPGPWTKDPRGGGVVRGSTLIEFVRGSSYTQVALAVGLHEKEAGGQEENATFIANAPADIAALIAEVKRLREALKQACTCVTCNGAGEIDVVTGYKDNGPNDPIEVYELDECPECAGQKIGLHVEESTARVLEDCQ